MKVVFVCALLALAFALVSADCNPDGDGKPACTAATDVGQKFRNFWDPTRYWLCAASGVVETVLCPTAKGYDPLTKECISWDDWNWLPPCP